MRKRKDKFAKDIYEYCDSHIGDKVLSLVFSNFYPEEKLTEKRNKSFVARYTSSIVRELVQEGVLKEVKKSSKFNNPYGMYKILKHEDLVDKNLLFNLDKRAYREWYEKEEC
jgi:hypothetical protein